MLGKALTAVVEGRSRDGPNSAPFENLRPSNQPGFHFHMNVIVTKPAASKRANAFARRGVSQA